MVIVMFGGIFTLFCFLNYKHEIEAQYNISLILTTKINQCRHVILCKLHKLKMETSLKLINFTNQTTLRCF